jgi:DNA-directed RNA polymerase subunit RPC12/RpoP
MQFIPCFLCGRKLEMRTTKNGKPYVVCDRCGIQLFIRGRQGIERLETFLKNAEAAEIPFKQHARSFYELQALLKEIDDVQQEIEKLGISYFLSDVKLRVRNLLVQRKETLFSQLEEFSKR